MVALKVEADEFKLYRVSTNSASSTRRATASLGAKRHSRVKTDDFGELVRRINLIKGSKYQILEMVGNPHVRDAKANFTPTNVDSLIGRETLAQTDIKPVEGGLIKLFGEKWFARAEGDDLIPRGSSVRVLRVEGVSLIVEEVEGEEKQ
jgi:hypothetical protein